MILSTLKEAPPHAAPYRLRLKAEEGAFCMEALLGPTLKGLQGLKKKKRIEIFFCGQEHLERKIGANRPQSLSTLWNWLRFLLQLLPEEGKIFLSLREGEGALLLSCTAALPPHAEDKVNKFLLYDAGPELQIFLEKRGRVGVRFTYPLAKSAAQTPAPLTLRGKTQGRD